MTFLTIPPDLARLDGHRSEIVPRMTMFGLKLVSGSRERLLGKRREGFSERTKSPGRRASDPPSCMGSASILQWQSLYTTNRDIELD